MVLSLPVQPHFSLMQGSCICEFVWEMVLEIVLEMVPQLDLKNRLKFISQTIKSSKISPQEWSEERTQVYFELTNGIGNL